MFIHKVKGIAYFYFPKNRNESNTHAIILGTHSHLHLIHLHHSGIIVIIRIQREFVIVWRLSKTCGWSGNTVATPTPVLSVKDVGRPATDRHENNNDVIMVMEIWSLQVLMMNYCNFSYVSINFHQRQLKLNRLRKSSKRNLRKLEQIEIIKICYVQQRIPPTDRIGLRAAATMLQLVLLIQRNGLWSHTANWENEQLRIWLHMALLNISSLYEISKLWDIIPL